MNVFNIVWDFFLICFYWNGMIVLDNWDINGFQIVVSIDGILNDFIDFDCNWLVEIVIFWVVLVEVFGLKEIFKNIFWCINFFRVNWDYEFVNGQYRRKKDKDGELLLEYNWVWFLQYKINMYMLEYWGYVYFVMDFKMCLDDFVIFLDDQIKWYLY